MQLLPEGTMVVAHQPLTPIGGGAARQKGSAATVVGAPRDADHAYRVRFPDGVEATAKREQLAILKHYQNVGFGTQGEVLEEYDLYHHVIYRCVVGSRAYGLAREDSDVDRRGIYLPPADMHWSLWGVPEQLENDETEEVYWEIQKFVTLALKANPNVLECLYTPMVEHADELAEELLSKREIFLSQLVYQTYSRYVMSQFKKFRKRREKGKKINWKHAMHLIRLLISGITVLREGFVPVDMSEHRQQLLAIRDGAWSWEEVNSWRLELQAEIDEAFEKTDLPERPDYSEANAFLIRARRKAVGAS